MPRKIRDDVILPGDPDSREAEGEHVLSKEAWGCWLGVLAVFAISGIVTDQPGKYYTIGILALILGLTPLWIADRVIHRIHQRKR